MMDKKGRRSLKGAQADREAAWKARWPYRGVTRIENHEQLKVTQEQRQRLEYALAELRQTAPAAICR